MATPTTFTNDVQVNGNLSVGTFSIPDGTVDDDAVAAGADIDGAKLQKVPQPIYKYGQFDDAAVADDQVVYIAEAAATVEEVAFGCYTAPTGADRTIDVEVKKNGTTILSSAIRIDNDDSDRDMLAGTLAASPTNLAAGDWLTVHITVAGSAGNQGQGLAGWIKIHEDANA